MTGAAARTPLYASQKALGGRFVPFSGWEMPLQFAGIVAEHRAVRGAVGLFDVSHMGEIVVHGPQALAACQAAVTRDLAGLVDGGAAYSLLCNTAGGILDDLIVYREAHDRYLLCVNAARRAADLVHLAALMQPFDCEVRDDSDAWALLALQGPKAAATLAALAPLAPLNPFCWATVDLGGVPARVARTGYTGEPGFEIFCASHAALTLYAALLQAGQRYGLQPCGLGARDTLRLEMKYPLYGSDLDPEHNPYEAGLGWAVQLHKQDFCGRARLAELRAAGPLRRWVGFVMVGRGIARPGHLVVEGTRAVGMVTSGSFAPSLQRAIGCAYVPKALAAVGTPLTVQIRDQGVAAEVVPTPFYRPPPGVL